MATHGLPHLWRIAVRERVLRWVSRPAGLDEDGELRKKPADLVYDVDETPPLAVQLGLSVQHIFMMSVGWLYITVIAGAMGATHSQAESLIQMSMLAGGLTTILQASRTRFGSGYFCPLSGSLSYMPPSIVAATSGGFPLLFGMIAAAGAFSVVLSRAIRRLRFLFPPEVTGLMIAMSGLQLISISCTRFVGLAGGVNHPGFRPLVVGLLTLLAMIVATVWLRGLLHVMPMLLGLAVGFGASLALGVLPWQEFLRDFHEPWLSIPHRIPGGLAFSWVLLAPFLIASLTATLKAVGDLTLCQKINDEDWKRTNMASVSGGLFANGAGTLLAGLFGGAAQNTVSSSIGLSLATGATSRAIAIPTGLLVMALAFLPKISAMLSAMPTPVMGAMLIYAACFIVLGGVQLLTSRMLDARRIFVAGISLIFGLSVEISPEIYTHVPAVLHPVVASSTSLATVLVVLLSLLMRIGVARQGALTFRPRMDSFESIHRFMEQLGAGWGMRREVEIRAEHAIHETVGNVMALNPGVDRVLVLVEFDELRLKVDVEYSGAAPVLASEAPSPEDLATDAGIAALSGFLIRKYADRVSVKSPGMGVRIQLEFEH